MKKEEQTMDIKNIVYKPTNEKLKEAIERRKKIEMCGSSEQYSENLVKEFKINNYGK